MSKRRDAWTPYWSCRSCLAAFYFCFVVRRLAAFFCAPDLENRLFTFGPASLANASFTLVPKQVYRQRTQPQDAFSHSGTTCNACRRNFALDGATLLTPHFLIHGVPMLD